MQAGLLSREIMSLGCRRCSGKAEGHIAGGAMREPSADPARSKNLCMHGISMRENREIPGSSVRPITERTAEERPRPES